MRCGLIAAIVFVLLFAACVVVGNVAIIPLFTHWNTRTVAYYKAEKWSNSIVCQNADVKESLDGFDGCLEHRQTLQHSPFALAVRDVLEDYWCERGQCLVPRFDLFQLLFNVVPTIIILGIVMISAFACFCFLRMWRSSEQSYVLPSGKQQQKKVALMASQTIDQLMQHAGITNRGGKSDQQYTGIKFD